jgi:hypothetical protein
VAFLRLTSPEMGPVFEISGTGEAPGEEREYGTFVLLVHEVEPIRKAATRKAITKEANLGNLGK